MGVPNAIPRLAARQLQSTLAVSIHAPTQALRESVVPSARAYPLDALMADCQEYFRWGAGGAGPGGWAGGFLSLGTPGWRRRTKSPSLGFL